MSRQTSKAPHIALPSRAPRKDTPSLALAKKSMEGERTPHGSVRPAIPHRGEVARHRVMTADGRDIAVATASERNGFVTGVYPVQHGYLVMMYQPIYEAHCATADLAHEQHEQLVRALADIGLGVIRARKRRKQIPPSSEEVSQAPTEEAALVRTA
jgi:hypothetical protein